MDVNDKTKTFLYLEDNGDGTCTTIMSISELNFFQTAVMTMDFKDYLQAMMQGVPAELLEEMAATMVHIPDSLED